MQENKEQLEICAHEGAASQIVRFDSPAAGASSSSSSSSSSPSPCRSSLWPQSFERLRVDRWFHCSATLSRSPEAKFNNFLKLFFLITLGLGVKNIMFCNMTEQRFKQLRGTVLLQVCAAVVVVAVLVTTVAKSAGSAPPREAEARAISAVVQHV